MNIGSELNITFCIGKQLLNTVYQIELLALPGTLEVWAAALLTLPVEKAATPSSDWSDVPCESVLVHCELGCCNVVAQ